jgi:hypothetical protein
MARTPFCSQVLFGGGRREFTSPVIYTGEEAGRIAAGQDDARKEPGFFASL